MKEIIIDILVVVVGRGGDDTAAVAVLAHLMVMSVLLDAVIPWLAQVQQWHTAADNSHGEDDDDTVCEDKADDGVAPDKTIATTPTSYDIDDDDARTTTMRTRMEITRGRRRRRRPRRE